MLQISILQTETDQIIERLKIKKYTAAAETIGKVLEYNQVRKSGIAELELQRAEMNRISKSVGMEMAKGNTEAAEIAKKQTAELKISIASLESNLTQIETLLQEQLVLLPNIPHPDVPPGNSSEDNKIVQQVDKIFNTEDSLIPHWELAKNLNLIDFETGSKITGAGFPVYIGKMSRFQRALINFFLDEASKAGYTEYQVPHMVNEASGFGTGQLPDKEGQMYHATEDNFYLIPTAEVPLTNIWRDEIIDEDKLPIKMCGYTPCFRREAGSYGKDVRGLNRLHQFDKVEIVQIVHPDKSYIVLEEMLAYVQSILTKLDLNYRTALLCGGDLGFTSAKTYDLEVFSAAQNRWLEVSSVSNFESYQTNRLKLRFRDQNKKIQLAHSLNGSALALPRIVACIMEQYQTSGGTIRVPEVLIPYTGFEEMK